MKRIFLLIFILNISFLLHIQAQAPAGKLSGQIKDLHGNALSGASVILQNLTDTLNKQTRIADPNGNFVFNNLLNSNYMFVVSHIGFGAYRIDALNIDNAHRTIVLPLIVLQPATGNTLKAVIITARKPLIEQQIDRTVVNVDAMLSAAGGNALEVLSKSPGVIVGANDDISLNGKNNVLVLIDDRPTYLSGQSLAAYLRSLPGGMLDKLELVSNPPAKYDANGGAVINIVLKKNQAAGFSGALNLGYNQGVYARSNDALNANYRSPKFNMFGNLGYSRDQNFSDQTFSRYFFDNDASLNQTSLQTSRSVYRSDGWNGRIGMDYFASAKTTLGIVLTGSTRPRSDNFSYVTNQYNGAGQLDSLGRGFTDGRSTSRNFGVNLNLQHKYAQAGRSLSVNLDQLNYLSGNDRFSPLEEFKPDGSFLTDHQRMFTAPSSIHIYAGKADYILPLDKGSEFSVGLKSSYVNTDNQSNWFNGEGGAFIPDYRNSNRFTYHENINSAYINLKKDWKRWSVQTGLRLENTNARGHQLSNPLNADSAFTRHYTNLFPSFYLMRRLDSAGNHTLTLSVSRRVARPSYQQLNPFLFYQDQYTYNAGNPNLVPAFAQYVELKYSFRQYFGLAVSYGGGNNGINQLTQAQGTLLITRPFNYVDTRLIGLIPYISLSPANCWTLNLQAVLLFQHIRGGAGGVNLNQRTSVHEIETMNQFQISKTWSAELNGFFPGAQTYAQTSNRSVYNISAGIQKRIWKDQGSIRLTANDLFHTLPVNSQTLGINGVSAYSTRAADSRYAGLSLIYRFGKVANARKRNDSSSAEEEKGRTN